MKQAGAVLVSIVQAGDCQAKLFHGSWVKLDGKLYWGLATLSCQTKPHLIAKVWLLTNLGKWP